jgi:hypothetical protein
MNEVGDIVITPETLDAPSEAATPETPPKDPYAPLTSREEDREAPRRWNRNATSRVCRAFGRPTPLEAGQVVSDGSGGNAP